MLNSFLVMYEFNPNQEVILNVNIRKTMSNDLHIYEIFAKWTRSYIKCDIFM